MKSIWSILRRPLIGSALLSAVVASLSACGGGGSGYAEVGVAVPVVQRQVVSPLSLILTRVGPLAIELDWSDHPYVHHFVVLRNGYLLATVDDVALIDNSVYFNETHCYQVQGYSAASYLIASSGTGCITVYP